MLRGCVFFEIRKVSERALHRSTTPHFLHSMVSNVFSAIPEFAFQPFYLMTTFPSKVIEAEGQTLKDSGLLNSVIVVRHTWKMFLFMLRIPAGRSSLSANCWRIISVASSVRSITSVINPHISLIECADLPLKQFAAQITFCFLAIPTMFQFSLFYFFTDCVYVLTSSRCSLL